MHPLFKYILCALFAALTPAAQAEKRSPVHFWTLDNQPVTLAQLTHEKLLFIAKLANYKSPDEPLRFITLVEGSQFADRSKAILCIPLETTNYLSRKAKAALIKRYIKGDYMRGKLHFVDTRYLETLLGSHNFALFSGEKPLWQSPTCPPNEESLPSKDDMGAVVRSD